jgi:hypothetical protein
VFFKPHWTKIQLSRKRNRAWNKQAGSGWFFVPWCGRTPNWAYRPAFKPVTGLVKAE